MSTTKTTIKVTAAVLALVATLTLAGCGQGDKDADVTPPVTGTTSAAPEPTPVPTPTVVADEFSQVVDGTLFQGTAGAPVKIGDDAVGVAPAAEATFPVHGGFEAIKPAARALDTAKYTVVVAPTYGASDVAAEGPILGYRWLIFRVNEYGNWKAGEASSSVTPFPTQEAAASAPHTLDGRVLDRAEFVIAYY